MFSAMNPCDPRRAFGSDWLSGFELVDYPKACLISTPNSRQDSVFIVRSGRLRVYLAGENRELSLCLLESGDIYTTHTPAYVRTVTPATLWTMATRDFARQLASDPVAAPAVMRVLGRLLVGAVTLIDDLAFRDVPARLARFLVGLAERRGERDDAGWRVPIDMSTEDLASLLGTTRQTVSGLINCWQRDGLLQRQGRHSLLIRSLDGIAAHAAPTPGKTVGRPTDGGPENG